MIVYLEGPDGSGKTTFAQKLVYACITMDKSVELSAHLINTDPRKEPRLSKDIIFNRFEQMRLSDTIHILDRGPISDIVYRCFDKIERTIELDEFLNFIYEIELNPRVSTRRMMIVHCDTQAAEMMMKARGDDNPKAIEFHYNISQIYKQIMPLFKAEKYDFTEMIDLERLMFSMLYELGGKKR